MYIDDDLAGLEDDEFQFAAQHYKEPLAQLSDLPPLTIKGHKHLFSNLLHNFALTINYFYSQMVQKRIFSCIIVNIIYFIIVS